MKPIALLAWLTALVSMALITLGGYVHATGSSLACPDWPLCYGQAFPEMVGGVAIEHSHRLLGALVGLLTIALTVLTWRTGPGLLRRLGWIALVLVIFQGVLGGVTVLLRLPTLVSTAHLGVSLVYVGVIVWIAILAAPNKRFANLPAKLDRLRRWTAISTASVYAQALLGGLVRHTASGMACSTDPWLCAGEWLPDWGRGQLHMSHRVAAILVSAWLVVCLVEALRVCREKELRPVRGMAIGSVGNVALQIGLGISTVASGLGLISVTLHLTLGAVLVLHLWAMYLLMRLGRAGGPASAGAAAGP